jgi:hypothetical protein
MRTRACFEFVIFNKCVIENVFTCMTAENTLTHSICARH